MWLDLLSSFCFGLALIQVHPVPVIFYYHQHLVHDGDDHHDSDDHDHSDDHHDQIYLFTVCRVKWGLPAQARASQSILTEKIDKRWIFIKTVFQCLLITWWVWSFMIVKVLVLVTLPQTMINSNRQSKNQPLSNMANFINAIIKITVNYSQFPPSSLSSSSKLNSGCLDQLLT